MGRRRQHQPRRQGLHRIAQGCHHRQGVGGCTARSGEPTGGIQTLIDQTGLEGVGGLAQAATHQTAGINPKPEQHRQGGGGTAGHAFRQQQRAGPCSLEAADGRQLGAPAQAALQQGRSPRQGHRSPRTQAPGGSCTFLIGQPQMGNGRCHRAAQIHHQGAGEQTQLLQHHMADQGRAHPRRQGRQGMEPLRQGPAKQQFGISGRGLAPRLGAGTSGRNALHSSGVGGREQQQCARGGPGIASRHLHGS